MFNVLQQLVSAANAYDELNAVTLKCTYIVEELFKMHLIVYDEWEYSAEEKFTYIWHEVEVDC